MTISDAKMWETVFDYVYDALTIGPAGVGGGASYRSTSNSILQLQLPGLPVDVNAFANEWSPSNPSGTTVASENFSRLIDFIPNMGVKFDGSTKGRIEKIYGEEVVNAAVTPPPADPAKQEAYDKAFALLFVDGTDYNDLGQPITVKVKSPIYKNYENKRIIYDAAVLSYMTAYLAYDLKNPADQRSWSILAPRLITPVNLAWSDLQSAHPGMIETALATIGQDEASSLAKRFNDAKSAFDLTKRQSLFEPGVTWHWAQAYPGNWFSPSLQGSPITVTSDKYYTSSSSNYSSWSAGGGLNLGFFSIGGGGGGSSSRTSVVSDSSSLRLSFQMSRAQIYRPWFDSTLLSLTGWSVAGRPRHSYSSGQISAGNAGIFSLVPTAFITASHITITANWGHSDLQTISSHSHGGGGLSIGPFSIGGSGGSSSYSSRYSSSFDGRTLSCPGTQIIGWVSQLVPASPPIGG